jgi:hypothetical protein
VLPLASRADVVQRDLPGVFARLCAKCEHTDSHFTALHWALARNLPAFVKSVCDYKQVCAQRGHTVCVRAQRSRCLRTVRRAARVVHDAVRVRRRAQSQAEVTRMNRNTALMFTHCSTRTCIASLLDWCALGAAEASNAHERRHLRRLDVSIGGIRCGFLLHVGLRGI